MKNMKQWGMRGLSMFIALVMCAGMAVPAFAADAEGGTPPEGQQQEQDANKSRVEAVYTPPAPDKSDPDKQDPEKEDAGAQDPDEEDAGAQDPDKEDAGKADATPGPTPQPMDSKEPEPVETSRAELPEIKPEDVLQRPEEGKETTKTETTDNGNGTKTTVTTTNSEVKYLEDGYGYTATVTETIRVETVTAVPAEKPAGAVDITEDGKTGYRFTETVTLPDGTIRTNTVTVFDGKATSWYEKTETKTVTKKVEMDKATGELVVTLYEAQQGENHGEDKDPNGSDASKAPMGIEIIDPGDYWANDLRNPNDAYKDAAVCVIAGNQVNVRKEPGGTPIGSLNVDNNAMVYVYETEGDWCRIGADAWVHKTFLVEPGNYYVATNTGTLGFRESYDAGAAQIARLGKNTVVTVLGGRLDTKNVMWYNVSVDGKTGWVSSQYMKPVERYTVTTQNGGNVNIRNDANGASVVASAKTGAAFTVYGEKKDANGKIWYCISEKGDQWIRSDFLTKTSTVPAPEFTPDYSKYKYYYLGEKGLGSSIRVEGSTGNPRTVHQFILEDEATGKYYVYCADYGTSAKDDYGYTMVSMDELVKKGQMKAEDLDKLKVVVQNGYWGNKDEANIGSMAAVTNNLGKYLGGLKDKDSGKPLYTKDEIEDIVGNVTPGMALTATQAAIWYYTNRDSANFKIEDWYKAASAGSYDKEKNQLVGAGIPDVINDGTKLSEAEQLALRQLFESLIKANPQQAQLITKEDFAQKVTVTVKDEIEPEVTEIVNGKEIESAAEEISYRTDVAIVMGVTKDDISGELKVQVFANGSLVAEEDFFDKGGKGLWNENTFTISDVVLPNGAKLDIQLTGTQDLGQGVYVFESQKKNGEASQTFIGLSEDRIEKNVSLGVKLDFDVTAAKATITTTETVVSSEAGGNGSSGGQNQNSTETPPAPVTPPPPEEEIEDPDVPLAELPEEPPEIEIDDPDVPLSDVPQTGDGSWMWSVVAGLSILGLAVLALGGKRKKIA